MPGASNRNPEVIHFAYGANLSRDHMKLWCPDSQPLTRAALPDYRLAFRFWADIVTSPGDEVPGALYAIDGRDLTALDEYEDCPDLYGRTHLTVRTEAGPVEALIYQMRPGYAFAPPVPDYLNLIKQGYQDWGLDPNLLPGTQPIDMEGKPHGIPQTWPQ